MTKKEITEIARSSSKLAEFDGHERIIPIWEETSKGTLEGFIAIHSTHLGPSVGGTRFVSYTSAEAALKDALNLSKSMSYKCALANVPFGGAKGVVNFKPSLNKEEILGLYTSYLNNLNGLFYTGEDVGLNELDIQFLAKNSKYIIGRPGVGGLPGPWAALGVYYAIKGAVNFKFGNRSLMNKTIATKGVGEVGGNLVKLLTEEGAQILVADTDPTKITRIKTLYPSIQEISPDNIHEEAVDIFAPCALGHDLTADRISELGSKIVCGAANNQLESPEAGKLLKEKGVLYVPDYIANAGGLISVADELNPGGYSKSRVTKRIEEIEETVYAILKTAELENTPTNFIADKMAVTKINYEQ